MRDAYWPSIRTHIIYLDNPEELIQDAASLREYPPGCPLPGYAYQHYLLPYHTLSGLPPFALLPLSLDSPFAPPPIMFTSYVNTFANTPLAHEDFPD